MVLQSRHKRGGHAHSHRAALNLDIRGREKERLGGELRLIAIPLLPLVTSLLHAHAHPSLASRHRYVHMNCTPSATANS